MKANNVETGSDLASMIAANKEKQKARFESLVANIEAKYCQPGKKRKAIDNEAGPSKRRAKKGK